MRSNYHCIECLLLLFVEIVACSSLLGHFHRRIISSLSRLIVYRGIAFGVSRKGWHHRRHCTIASAGYHRFLDHSSFRTPSKANQLNTQVEQTLEGPP